MPTHFHSGLTALCESKGLFSSLGLTIRRHPLLLPGMPPPSSGPDRPKGFERLVLLPEPVGQAAAPSSSLGPPHPNTGPSAHLPWQSRLLLPGRRRYHLGLLRRPAGADLVPCGTQVTWMRISMVLAALIAQGLLGPAVLTPLVALPAEVMQPSWPLPCWRL